MMTTTAPALLDISAIRQQFPILHQEVNGHPLVYLDNAATAQKPEVVIAALTDYYHQINSNVHRGAHTLADRATRVFEETRETARAFLGAASTEEIIFTRGTTEGLNLIASSYGRRFVGAGDEIIISTLEHHSNIVPWQMLCEEKGAVLKVIPINEAGELDLEAYARLLSPRTRIVSVMHVSNALGTINPIEEIIRLAHQAGAVVVVDGAQSSPHFELHVQQMDCDFFVFSSHKVYGPTGMGILYGKKALLEVMPPYHGGGEMIKEVTFERTTYNVLPYKFEAGTPNIADTIALGEALRFVLRTGREQIGRHEQELLRHGTALLQDIKGIRLVGTAAQKVGVISFVAAGAHHYDIGMLLDANGIAVRTGHHCAQPLMRRLGIEGTVRASFAVYNTHAEVERLAEALEKVLQMLR